MLNNELLIRRELTNIGAWFSANMYNQYYILQDCDTCMILNTYKLTSLNWSEALDYIIDDIENWYGKIIYVCYWHSAGGFKITIEDCANHENRSLFLLPLDTIKEVN